MKALIWRHGPAVVGLCGWFGLFYWGAKPALLAGAVIVVAWLDGYVMGREGK